MLGNVFVVTGGSRHSVGVALFGPPQRFRSVELLVSVELSVGMIFLRVKCIKLF